MLTMDFNWDQQILKSKSKTRDVDGSNASCLQAWRRIVEIVLFVKWHIYVFVSGYCSTNVTAAHLDVSEHIFLITVYVPYVPKVKALRSTIRLRILLGFFFLETKTNSLCLCRERDVSRSHGNLSANVNMRERSKTQMIWGTYINSTTRMEFNQIHVLYVVSRRWEE